MRTGTAVQDVAKTVAALVGDKSTDGYLITDMDVLDLCQRRSSENVEWVKVNTTPHDLSTPNLPLIEASSRERTTKTLTVSYDAYYPTRLLIALQYKRTVSAGRQERQMVVLEGDNSFPARRLQDVHCERVARL